MASTRFSPYAIKYSNPDPVVVLNDMMKKGTEFTDMVIVSIDFGIVATIDSFLENEDIVKAIINEEKTEEIFQRIVNIDFFANRKETNEIVLKIKLEMFQKIINKIDSSINGNRLLTFCINSQKVEFVVILLHNKNVLSKIENSPLNGNGLTGWSYSSKENLSGYRNNKLKEMHLKQIENEDDETLEMAHKKTDEYFIRKLIVKPVYFSLVNVIESSKFQVKKEVIFFLIRIFVRADPLIALKLLKNPSSVTSFGQYNLLTSIIDIGIPRQERIDQIIALLLIIFTHEEYEPMSNDKMEQIFYYCRVHLGTYVTNICSVWESQDGQLHEYQIGEEDRMSEWIEGKDIEEIMRSLSNKALEKK